MNCKYLTMNNAKIKDRVILANPNSFYRINRTNPAINSSHFCRGTVSDIVRSRISVKWDNGSKNNYCDGELALFEKKSLSVQTENGRYTSIW